MEALDKSDRQSEKASGAESRSDQPAAGPAKEGALSLAGLAFFLVDIQAKRIVWLESGALDFEQRAGLNEAPLSTALRLLSQTDQKQILGLIQNAVKYGEAGPAEALAAGTWARD